MFRCKSVINSDDHRMQVLRQIGQIIVRHFRLTEYEAAAVNVENHWTGFAISYRLGSVETKAQLCTVQPISPDRLTTRLVSGLESRMDTLSDARQRIQRPSLSAAG